jgi:hypothetical protein
MTRGVLFLAALALCATATPAGAYEYEVMVRTVGQIYELPTLRMAGADLWLARRRYTQTLTLSMWDVGDLRRQRLKAHPGLPDDGPVVWFTGHLRLDHDFGAWTAGTLRMDAQTLDAIDAIPDLAASSIGLDLLYGYLAVDGLAGRVDLRIGRQLDVDALDWWSVDGITARVHTPWPVLFEATAGLRVRDRSPLGAADFELDGTASADCHEYVEGPTPGTGSWQIIDRSRVPGESRLGSDLAYCPERDAMLPTGVLAVETEDVRWLFARVAYRRTQSRTPGLIGPVDRLDFPDSGVYPDEVGQAPAWGVDEEHASAVVRGTTRAGGVGIEPWVQARYSLLHGVADEAQAGVRVTRGVHALEPEVARSVPTFDGDSIWNVFAVGTSWDARLTYDLAPRHGAYRGFATAWLRRYEAPAAGDARSWVAGLRTGAEADVAPRIRARLDLVGDDGYGGRRVGATATARWQRTRALAITGRLGGLDVKTRDTDRPIADGFSGVGQVAASWKIDEGIAVHATTELAHSPRVTLDVRAVAVLDLSFEPETH